MHIYSMRGIILSSVLCLSSLALYAQAPGGRAAGPGKVFGKVKDAASKKSIEYATISLVKPGEARLASGTTTAADGSFLIENLSTGAYIVKITFLGYGMYQSDTLKISDEEPLKDLGTILLKASAQSLKGAEIVADAPMVVNEIDKRVYNTEKLLATSGGSAVDILNQIPSVNVDIDGNLSLRGSEGVTVLVDGRPSGITGGSRQAILESIPASSIERIEVITNPNAKYDADGQAGIINVVLKKNKTLGLTGSVTLGAGTRGKYNAAANLNYRNKRFNLFANYSFRRNNSFNNGSSFRTSYLLDSLYQQNTRSEGLNKRMNHMARLGMDIFINPRNTIGISGGFGYNPGNSVDATFYSIFDSSLVQTNDWARTSSEKQLRYNYDLNLNYKHQFKKANQELSLDISYSGNNENEEQLYENAYYNWLNAGTVRYYERQRTTNLSQNSNFVASLDYTHPFKKNYSLETGVKYTARHNDNDFTNFELDPLSGEYIANPFLTNRFVYHEQVYGAYAQMAKAYKKFGYKLGLRVEETLINTDLVTTQTKNARNYFSWFPSVFLSYKINDKNDIKLNYSRRISRPGFRQLNTFTNYSDPLNLNTGNPMLNPEYTNSFEFSYSYGGNKYSISPTLYYRYTTNVISRYRTVNADGVSITSFENFNNAHSAGCELTARMEFFKWWYLMPNMNLYYYQINGSNVGTGLRNWSIGGMGRILTGFKITKWMEAQATYGFWWAPASPQGRPKPVQGLDLGLKADLFKNKLSLNLSLQDVFNTRRFALDGGDVTFVNSFTRKRETRILNLSLTYKFGKQDFGSRRNRKGGGDGGDMNNGGGEDW